MSKLSDIDELIAALSPGDSQLAVLQAEREDILERAERAKRSIGELRQQWQRLHDSGSLTGEQSRISGSIEHLQETLKGMTGEDF